MACRVSQMERDSPEKDEGSGSNPDTVIRCSAEDTLTAPERRGFAHRFRRSPKKRMALIVSQYIHLQKERFFLYMIITLLNQV